MSEERSVLNEEQLDLMLHTLEGNVDSAYLFFKQLLETDSKLGPEVFVSGKMQAAGEDLGAAQHILEAEFSGITTRYMEDLASGRSKEGRFSPENYTRLTKASVLLLMMEKTKKMVSVIRVNQTVAAVSLLAIWSGKFLSFCKSAHEQPLDNVYTFYYYDGYPHFRALCESCRVGFQAQLSDALAEPEIQKRITDMLNEKMSEYYKGVGYDEKDRPEGR